MPDVWLPLLVSMLLLRARGFWPGSSRKLLASAVVLSALAGRAGVLQLWQRVGLRISSLLRGACVKQGHPWWFGEWSAFCPCCKRPMKIELSLQSAEPDPPAAVRGKYAFLICLWGASREYLLGALVLGYSIKRTGSKHDRVCLYTSDVPHAHIQLLSRLWICRPISHIDVAMEQLSFPDKEDRFAKVFTKLNGLALTEYEKVLMMDIDLLVRRNIDDLFELTPPAALRRGMNEVFLGHGQMVDGRRFFLGTDKSMPRWSWGQGTGINAGVMLWRPDQAVLDQMLDELTEPNHPEHVKGNGPEQDYLSRFWADAPWTYIGVEYNFQLHQMFFALHPERANYAERSVLLQTPEEIRVVHFSGKPTAKPWHRVLDKAWQDFWPARSRDAEYVERFAEEFMGYWLWVKRDREKFEAQAGGNSWDMAGLELNQDGEFFRHFKDGREPEPMEIPAAASQGAMNLLSQALGEWFDALQDLQAEFNLDLQALACNEPLPSTPVATARPVAPLAPVTQVPRVPRLRHVAWRRHGGRGGWFVESDKADVLLPTVKLTVLCSISEESASVCLRDSRTEMFEDEGSHVKGLYVKLAGFTAARQFHLPEELSEDALSPLHFWVDSVPNGAIVMLAVVGMCSYLPTILEMLAPLGVPQVAPPQNSRVLACISTCGRPLSTTQLDVQDVPCAHHASPDVAYASLLMEDTFL
ncbi:unnamed protein product [Symbiodinium pilosum]|uniref:Uncharacterized protein n=1 Tax=Symbiodinium pilosum TaxID=2952 RepID=A0A812ULC8_SYMPI|nr:unnamed protein product [Symbiodinium pilosum]